MRKAHETRAGDWEKDFPKLLDVIFVENESGGRWMQVLSLPADLDQAFSVRDLKTAKLNYLCPQEYERARSIIGSAFVEMFATDEQALTNGELRQPGEDSGTFLESLQLPMDLRIEEGELANIFWGADRNTREMKLHVTVWGKFTKKNNASETT